MRVGVLAYNQTINDTPYRFISKREAASYFDSCYQRISKKLIRERFPNSIPSSNPLRHLKTKLKIVVPKIKAPGPQHTTTMNLFYPVKDSSSYAAYNLIRVWGDLSQMGNPLPYKGELNV